MWWVGRKEGKRDNIGLSDHSQAIGAFDSKIWYWGFSRKIENWGYSGGFSHNSNNRRSYSWHLLEIEGN